MGNEGQEWLESRSGLGQTTISRVLNQGGAATLDTIAALAKGLGVLPWELLVDDEETRQTIIRRFLTPAAPNGQGPAPGPTRPDQ